jgi:cytochrome c peroxidase
MQKFIATLLLVGCGGRASDMQPTTERPVERPAARPGADIISEEQWQALVALSPERLPAPPPDLSNEVADDPRAVAWGATLFFETRFSGPLIDSDNRLESPHGGVGMQGETEKVSCASCHVPAASFTDTRTLFRQLSLASGWSMRRAPSLLDVGQAKLLMWDGRFDSLQRQILAVFESPLEANGSRLFLAQQVARLYADTYLELFQSDPREVLGPTYPTPTASTAGCVMPQLTGTTSATEACTQGTRHGVPGAADYDAMSEAQQKEVTRIALNTGKALGAFLRTLTCGQGRFDAFMHGDATAMTAPEQRGAALFVGKAKCNGCHSGPFMSDQAFHNVGLFAAPVAGGAFTRANDPGAQKGFAMLLADPLNTRSEFSAGDDARLPSSIPASTLGAFRTPTLRCVSQRPSFMHTAQITRLRDTVRFFSAGGHKTQAMEADPRYGYLGETELEPLNLSDTEIDDITAFLRALDGKAP